MKDRAMPEPQDGEQGEEMGDYPERRDGGVEATSQEQLLKQLEAMRRIAREQEAEKQRLQERLADAEREREEEARQKVVAEQQMQGWRNEMGRLQDEMEKLTRQLGAPEPEEEGDLVLVDGEEEEEVSERVVSLLGDFKKLVKRKEDEIQEKDKFLEASRQRILEKDRNLAATTQRCRELESSLEEKEVQLEEKTKEVRKKRKELRKSTRAQKLLEENLRKKALLLENVGKKFRARENVVVDNQVPSTSTEARMQLMTKNSPKTTSGQSSPLVVSKHPSPPRSYGGQQQEQENEEAAENENGEDTEDEHRNSEDEEDDNNSDCIILGEADTFIAMPDLSPQDGTRNRDTAGLVTTMRFPAPPQIKIEVDEDRFVSVAKKTHSRDVTKRILGHYCKCGIRFKTKEKLAPHIVFWNNAQRRAEVKKNAPQNPEPPVKPKPSRSRSTPASGGNSDFVNSIPGYYLPERKFHCDVANCTQSFVGVSLLKMHKANVHGIKDDRFQIGCRICGEIFFSRSEHRSHQKRIHKEIANSRRGPPAIQVIYINDNTSPTPRAQPKQESHGIDERRTDPKAPVYYCLCNRWYKTPMDLSIHVKISEDMAKSSCRYCGRLIGNATLLRKHIKDAHKARKKPKPPFGCSCGKAYFSQAMLDKHFDSHFHRKMYRCVLCRKVFYQKEKLAAHRAQKHGQGQAGGDQGPGVDVDME